MSATQEIQVHESVKDYYGKKLQTNKDIQTNACCTGEKLSADLRNILAKVHEEILIKFYGCGSPIPAELEGRTALDLGCGTGRDVYVLSALVKQHGKVIGVDMTDEQLQVANKYIDYHTKQFGYEKSNVEFKKGYIELLDEAGIADSSVDVVVSNCVINLAADKQQVFKEIFRVLKEGGELYFSDIFADRRVPDALKNDSVLYGECLSGALYIEDFRRMMEKTGFRDYRVISSSRVTVDNPEVEKKLGNIKFYSKTIRAFKLSGLEDKCEDYGQKATYNGKLEGSPHAFILDQGHTFITDMPLAVCGNTADMVGKTRFSKYFTVDERKEHRGLFDCSSGASASNCDSGSCC